MHPDAARGFDRAHEAYERGRPGYPDEAVAWLCDRVGVAAGRRIVDLAAGTGKLTRALVGTGAALVGVDPVRAMLRTLRAATGGRVPTVAAVAQALPLRAASVDGLVVAQALHWFDDDIALTEMTRVLAPGGVIGLVWNVRVSDDPLQAALSAIIDPLRGDTPSHLTGRWRRVVDASPLVELTDSHAVVHEVPTDAETMVDRVASISFIAALPATARAAVARQVRAAAADAGPAPRMRYRCEVHVLTPR